MIAKINPITNDSAGMPDGFKPVLVDTLSVFEALLYTAILCAGNAYIYRAKWVMIQKP